MPGEAAVTTKPSQIEQILERQARSFELRRKLAEQGEHAAREALLHLREGPWVSISRQRGAGGLEVAQALGRACGWPVYDRQILAEIARHDHVREEILSRVERRAVSAFADYIAHVVAGDPSRPAYLQELAQVVFGLAKHGQVIFVGRGANWFLDGNYGLRVRVVAPTEARVARIGAQESLDPAAARRRVAEYDEQRRTFVRRLFDRDIDDPLGYDVVISTERLDLAGAAEVLRTALRAKLHAAV
jgi:cytidylate kinase